MNSIIVSCTQKNRDDFYTETMLGKFLSKTKIEHKIFFENTLGMPECYNNAIDNYKGTDNILLFVHDDIFINDILWEEKLNEAMQDYDVVGLAGSKKFSLSQGLDSQYNLVAWHVCSSREDWSGGVYHPTTNKVSENYNDIYWTEFGRCGQVIVIDGLFIGVNAKTIGDVRFDEDFTFDFYDLSFSLSCHKNNLKICTAPIAVTHYSHGEGIKNERYKKSQETFVKKWKN